MATDLRALRTDYVGEPLPDDVATADPWALFARWMDEAIEAELPEPNAMTVSTVRPDGRPHSRVVLLKEYSADGLVFFTDYGSAKGEHLAVNPVAGALFYWPGPMRQIHAVGTVTRLDRAASEAYFHSRPRASQISAAVSQQSRPLGSRAQLEAELAEATREIGDDEVPMPTTWGGFVVDVEEFEFWQGLPSRQHDRVRLTRTRDGWIGTRLYP
ncbi:MAG: pyridoxamine 5'-phosphate oxidase [Propionibacterium sp.]|nr:pyridoxamine 5'-phosphate oxidase [Propionibacterium sp.]